MNFLKIEHISTGYGKKQVLFDISFEMKKGETILLVGSNGSGKSTLLRTIYGLLSPWGKEGKIWYNGGEITNDKPSKLIKKGMVYIQQHNELFEEMTVKENLEISGMQTIEKGGLKDKVNYVFENIPTLKLLSKQECTRLSGGERKQLSLAMALMNKPNLIMLDEPLAGMSPKSTNEIIHQLDRLKGIGISLLIVEHRIKDAFGLADQVIGLKLGKLYKKNLNSIEKTKEVIL